MPRRTRGWVWAGRAAAAAVLIGLAAYLAVAGLDQAGRLAAPVGVVIALATLFAPFLLPAYQPPEARPAPPADLVPPGPGGVVIIADHGSVAAQHIGDVTMNLPRPDPDRYAAGE